MNFEQMRTDQQHAYIVGRLVLAIGNGTFNSEVTSWIMTLRKLGYDEGMKAGILQCKKEQLSTRRRSRSADSIPKVKFSPVKRGAARKASASRSRS